MDLDIITEENRVLLYYSPFRGLEWINEKFDRGENLIIKNTFRFSKEDKYEQDLDDNESIVFSIGILENEYYRIFKKYLNTKYDILIHKSYNISIKSFLVNSKSSIFDKFERLANQQIIIGGENINAIPIKAFNIIIDSFPTSTEINHYRDARITNVLSQYLKKVKDSEKAFENYLDKRNKVGAINTFVSLKEYEYDKYQFILKELKDMLINIENYREEDWQKQILEIILILYPKYINCFSKVQIMDSYSNPLKPKNRYIDMMLVDANGYVDVIEIKKPKSKSILTSGTYRDNYIPHHELSGTVMQVEKYLFHLTKWGKAGEDELTNRYKNKMSTKIKIKITNPKGFIILGMDDGLTSEQCFDFEIIKRKYSNIMDIMTYDDLVKRLESIILKFSESSILNIN